MENTNWSFPVPTDRNPNRDPRAWLLKVVIVRIELKQKDPTFDVRSLPPDDYDFLFWRGVRSYLQAASGSSTGDRVDLALERATLDAVALRTVTPRVEKNDNLREVLYRAARSILEAFLHAGGSSPCVTIWAPVAFHHLPHAMVGFNPHVMVASEQAYVDVFESDSELAIAYNLHAFLTSVLHLLTSVFQYLIGYVDPGGSKTYSSGAFDFRDSFISLVLFQGAYVWIKFRQAARPDCRKRKAPDVEHEVVDIEGCNHKGVYARPIKEKSSGDIIRHKYEPRFTPPRQEGDDGTDKCSQRLPLGEYHTPAEALIVLLIARYYYDKDGGSVELKDGHCKFLIPPMSEQERGLAGKEKRKWVTCRAKQVGKQMYANFQMAKGKQLAMATEASSHWAEINDPSSSALPLGSSSLPMLTTMAAEPAIASAAPSSPSPPSLPLDGAMVGDANDSCESLSGFEDMLAEYIYDPGLSNLPDHQSSIVSYQMQYQEFAQLPGDPSFPEVGAVPGGIEHGSEREVNPSPSFQQGRDLADAGTENMDGRIFLQQSDPDLQQVVFCEKCLTKCDNARQFVPLDQLKASQIQILRLQQENDSLKSRLQQVAKISSCHLDRNHD